MARPSQEQKILDAALHCFAMYGYDATRIRQIAMVAGVSEGALYRHYPSKEAVAQALFIHYLGLYVAELEAIAVGDASHEERLRAMAHMSLAQYRAMPDAFHFVLLRQPDFMRGIPAPFRYPIEVIEDLIRDGQQAHALREGQPNLLAAIFLGCILRPIIVSRLADPGALDLLHETRHDAVIADAAWAALARPASADEQATHH